MTCRWGEGMSPAPCTLPLLPGAGRWRSEVRPVSCAHVVTFILYTLGFYRMGLQTGKNQIHISPAAGSKGLQGLRLEGSPGPYR